MGSHGNLLRWLRQCMLETSVQWSIAQVKLTGLLWRLVLSKGAAGRGSVPACD